MEITVERLEAVGGQSDHGRVYMNDLRQWYGLTAGGHTMTRNIEAVLSDLRLWYDIAATRWMWDRRSGAVENDLGIVCHIVRGVEAKLKER